MEKHRVINGNVATEIADLRLEYSWGAKPIGVFQNRMEFYPETEFHHPHIIWEYAPLGVDIDCAADVEEAYIGLTITSERELIDYDGIFELPEMALQLLESLNINCQKMRELLKD